MYITWLLKHPFHITRALTVCKGLKVWYFFFFYEVKVVTWPSMVKTTTAPTLMPFRHSLM